MKSKFELLERDYSKLQIALAKATIEINSIKLLTFWQRVNFVFRRKFPCLTLSIPKEEVRQAIDNEPEYPDDMPAYIWNEIKNDKDAVTEALRITVKLTKKESKKD